MAVVTDQESLEALAESVQRLMEEKNLTQQALAEISGVRQDAISRLLRAKNDPSVCCVLRIADALGRTVNELFRRPLPKAQEKILQHSS